MVNIYSEIKEYLGYEDPTLSPGQLIETTDQIYQQTLQNRIKSLEDQIDQNKDNIVTKGELNEYFKQLADKIDLDSDGIVTKEELETYVDTQLKSGKEEIEKWKLAYQTLYDKHEQLQDQINTKEIMVTDVSQISSLALKDYIKSEIINTDANLGLVPDAIEKKIYLTVYKTIMKSLEGLFNTTSIDFLNHRVSFSINPIPIEERHISNKN